MAHPRIPELEELARRQLSQAGFELRGLQLLTHRIPMTLQVLAARADGSDISLDDCAALSGPLGEAIETAGVLPEPYVLEVSSPGVSDLLHDDRDFRSFRGFPVEVISRDASGREVRREGLLLERDAAAVLLNVRGRTTRIARESVVTVRLITPAGEA
jgi:ribosome maturation factor RimP